MYSFPSVKSMQPTRRGLCGLVLIAALPLGGCLSDAETAHNRSVLPAHTDKGDRSADQPRQLCESTVEGGESKMICY